MLDIDSVRFHDISTVLVGANSTRVRWHLCAILFACACGARTDLGGRFVQGAEGGSDAEVQSDSDAQPQVDVAVCDLSGDPSPESVEPYGTCGDGLNLSAPYASNILCNGAGLAAEFVPPQDFTVTRIEIFTTEGTVGLLDSSDCGPPGDVLFLSDVDTSGAAGDWRGATLSPPILLHAGHKYFIWQGRKTVTTQCSIVYGIGSQVIEYTTASDPHHPGPPWDGPYFSDFMARLDGTCH